MLLRPLRSVVTELQSSARRMRLLEPPPLCFEEQPRTILMILSAPSMMVSTSSKPLPATRDWFLVLVLQKLSWLKGYKLTVRRLPDLASTPSRSMARLLRLCLAPLLRAPDLTPPRFSADSTLPMPTVTL